MVSARRTNFAAARQDAKKPGRVTGSGRASFAPRRRGLLADRHQVDRGGLAAAVDLELELDSVALVEAGHAGPLDCGDVHERVGLAVVAGDEAEALHGVEELDRARGLLAGQLPLRATAEAAARSARTAGARLARRRPVGDRKRIALDLEVGRRNAAAAIDEGERKRLAVGEAGEARLLDRGDVDEHVLAAVVADDKAEALLPVEEFDDALAFADALRGHAAAETAAATATAATEAAAAAAETAAAAAAEAAAIAAAAAE